MGGDSRLGRVERAARAVVVVGMAEAEMVVEVVVRVERVARAVRAVG